MNSINLTQLETRVRRLERQNRILIALLLLVSGLVFMGATKGGSRVITADEVDTHRLCLINDKGNIVHQWNVHGGWMVEE